MKQPSKNTARAFYLICAFIVLYLFWNMIEPFALALLTAAIFAVILSPVDRQLHRVIPFKHISSLIVVLGLFLMVLLPLFFGGILVAQEARQLFANGNVTEIVETFDITETVVFESLPLAVQEQLSAFDLVATIKRLTEWMSANLSDFAGRGVQFLFNTFIFFVTLYSLLVSRTQVRRFLTELSPLKDAIDEDVIRRIITTIRTVVIGAIIIACVQALLATIGLTIFGVPGALLWGSLVILAAQIPTVGVGLVMVPAIAYLLITGQPANALGLTIWAITVVGLVDNLLSPILIGSRTKMPEVLVLISILGGLQLFGPIGFIVGPTVLASVMVIIELYKNGILEVSRTAK